MYIILAKKKCVAAVDLGASSGRVILVTLHEDRLELEEIHRFANEGIYVGERFYTDILHLFQEILTGLRKQKGWRRSGRDFTWSNRYSEKGLDI